MCHNSWSMKKMSQVHWPLILLGICAVSSGYKPLPLLEHHATGQHQHQQLSSQEYPLNHVLDDQQQNHFRNHNIPTTIHRLHHHNQQSSYSKSIDSSAPLGAGSGRIPGLKSNRSILGTNSILKPSGSSSRNRTRNLLRQGLNYNIQWEPRPGNTIPFVGGVNPAVLVPAIALLTGSFMVAAVGISQGLDTLPRGFLKNKGTGRFLDDIQLDEMVPEALMKMLRDNEADRERQQEIIIDF